MKAIVLTCDKYMKIADHMIQTYMKLWPDNPFVFRIPYEKYPHFMKKKYGSKIELVKAQNVIKQKVLKLLEDIPDDEWIYWCMDDKYLIDINKDKANQFYKWVSTLKDPKICGISFARAKCLLRPSNLKGLDKSIIPHTGDYLIERRNYSRIWLHQFLRSKALKNLFERFPERKFYPKEMDSFKDNMKLPKGQKLYVSEKNYVVFGESVSRGVLTKNCAYSFNNLNIKIPRGFQISDDEIIIGKMREESNSILKKIHRSPLYCSLSRVSLNIILSLPKGIKKSLRSKLESTGFNIND